MTPERKYNIRWQRVGVPGPDGGIMECHELTARTAFSRLLGAIRNTGPITVHKVEPIKRVEETP